MSTEKEPDYAGIAERLRAKEWATPEDCADPEYFEAMSEDLSKGWALCMEARLRSDWETIRLLRASDHIASCAMYDPVPLVPKDCDCGLSAHLSKLLEPFTP